MSSDDKNIAFILMPFSSEFDEIYKNFIAPVLSSAGFSPLRADDFLHQGSILRDIVVSIQGVCLKLS